MYSTQQLHKNNQFDVIKYCAAVELYLHWSKLTLIYCLIHNVSSLNQNTSFDLSNKELKIHLILCGVQLKYVS